MKTYLRHKIANVIDVKELIALEFLDFEGKYKDYTEKHDFWELCWVQEGEVVLSVNGVACKLCENEVVLIAPGQTHSYRSAKGNESCAFVICFESGSYAVRREVYLKMKKGEKNWVFCDGYLPPKGNDPAFEGHEALMLTNLNKETARIELVLIFENREPETGIFVELDGMRTVCLRMDEPLGAQKFMLDESVQYMVWVKSDIPVCACFGRLDVRQTNMAYYSPAGYSF